MTHRTAGGVEGSRDARGRARGAGPRAVRAWIAGLLVVGSVEAVGCAAREPAPSTAAKEEVAGAADAAPSESTKATTQMPGYPNISSADPAAAFDAAEASLNLAFDGKGENGVPLSTDADRCAAVCRALSSMRDAAAHLCQLDASRCEGVRARVTKAEARAKDSCPACASPT